MDEEQRKEIDRVIAGMTGGSATQAIEQPEKSSQTVTEQPLDIARLRLRAAELERKMEEFPETYGEKRVTKIYEPALAALDYDKLLPKGEDQNIWKLLGFSLGPAILGAALGKTPTGRALGLQAGAKAGAEYAGALSKREEKREEAAADLRKELEKKRMDLKLKMLEERAKGRSDDPAYKALAGAAEDAQKLINRAAGGEEVKKTFITSEKEPKIAVTQLTPGVVWRSDMDVRSQLTSAGQDALKKARDVVGKYTSLDDAIASYQEKLQKVGGLAKDPSSKEAQQLQLEYRDILLRAKEVYNLGVLNGGDLEQLEAIIPAGTLQLDGDSFFSSIKKLATEKYNSGIAEAFRNRMRNSMSRELYPLGFISGKGPVAQVQMTPQQKAEFENFKKSQGMQ